MKSAWFIIRVLCLVLAACGGSPIHQKQAAHEETLMDAEFAEPAPEAPLKYDEQGGEIPSQTVRFESAPKLSRRQICASKWGTMQLRKEIEARQGRLNYLKNQVGYSAIQLTYYKPYENYMLAPGSSFLLQAKQAFLGGAFIVN